MRASPIRTTATPGLGERPPCAMIVDDDPEIAVFLADNLGADRFEVLTASSAEEAVTLASTARPDVALVDVGLPGMSGFELVATLRQGTPDGDWDPGMAIIMVSGRADSQSVVRGMERGADDYVLKPFHYQELLARVSANLRRAQGVTVADCVRVGPLEIDRRSLSVSVHGRQVRLSAKEFGLLIALARDPNRVVTKNELLRDVWGFASAGRTRTVDSHASRLRGKLAAAGAGGWVRNVWGHGYRLLPQERS